MDRIHHVKMVTTDPRAVEDFLTEVVHVPPAVQLVPKGGARAAPRAPAAGSGGSGGGTTGETLDWDEVFRVRGPVGGGMAMVGDGTSRQFQVLEAEERAQIWAVAVGTRDLEGAHERSLARGIPTTDLRLFEFDGLNVRAFFARVGGILFEVARQEVPT